MRLGPYDSIQNETIKEHKKNFPVKLRLLIIYGFVKTPILHGYNGNKTKALRWDYSIYNPLNFLQK